MDLAGQIEATGQQVRIDVSTEPLQSYYTGLTFRGYVDGVSQYIVSGGRYDGLLSGFDGTPMPSVGMASTSMSLQMCLCKVKATSKIMANCASL